MDLRRPRLLAALQGLSWTWPPESEATNIEELHPVRDALAALLRDGVAEGTIRLIEGDAAVEAIMAAHVQGLRPAVFGRLDVAAATAPIQERLRALLAA